MNDERSKPDSDFEDRLVSATYRELSNESPSDAIDQAILRQAAVAAKPKYLRSMSWMRPVAWAATIALCFAIALEVTRVPQPEPDIIDAATNGIDSQRNFNRQRKDEKAAEFPSAEDRKSKDENAIDNRVEAELQDTLSGVAKSDLVTGRDANIAPAAKSPERVSQTEVKRASEQLSSPDDSSKSSAPSVADEFTIEDSDMMHDAEDIARSQSGNNKEAAAAPRTRSLSAAAYNFEADQPCDKEATATPATWIECIEELEKAGRNDAADRQRELLKLAFPEFELP